MKSLARLRKNTFKLKRISRLPPSSTKRNAPATSLHLQNGSEETENPAASDADEEAEERRGDAETQQREEREITPHELSNFLNPIKRNKRLAFFVLASFAIVVAGFCLVALV